jgi:hypothetical protein
MALESMLRSRPGLRGPARAAAAPRRSFHVGAVCAVLACAPLPCFSQARVEVGWISLEPQLPPPNSLDAPRGEGWPLEGDRVHWVAHLLNRGSETVAEVPYVWRIDDGTRETGEIDLPPGETTLWLAWSWTFERHHVSLRLEPPTGLGDASGEDDALEVVSDALSLGLGVEQDIYDWLLERDGPGFERFMQREIANWNAMLARAVHPSTPQGVLDRIRLEAVHLHPDDSRIPNDEFSTDLRWYFRARPSDSRFLNRAMQPRYLNDQTIILHELLHGRGLNDLYAYRVFHEDQGRTGSRVGIEEDGQLIVGTALMPNLNPASSVITVYRLPADGLMGTRYWKFANVTEHSAFGLNLLAGRRTPQWFDQWGNRITLGNSVQPEHYSVLIPERTDVRLLDQTGAPVADATVEVYLDHSIHTYQNTFASVPDRTLSSDSRGIVALPGDLLDELPVKHSAPPKSMVVILGVKTRRARGYPFLPLYDLNLLHFRGGGAPAEMELAFEMHPW